jgi:hypothetical protein
MGYRYLVPVYRIGMQFFTAFRFVMYHQLMSEKVKIYPMVGTTAFLTSQNLPVESAAFIQVVNRDGYVERGDILHEFEILSVPFRID